MEPNDLSSHMVQVGPMASGIFGGRGLAGVSAAQSSPWPAFGMLTGVPNGGLDGIHHFQGSLQPPLNRPLNMDMCLMEHGINRIVVDDVQVKDMLGKVKEAW